MKWLRPFWLSIVRKRRSAACCAAGAQSTRRDAHSGFQMHKDSRRNPRATMMVRSETSFLIVRIMRDSVIQICASGRHIDSYGLNIGAPKRRACIIVCDSSCFDTLLALPL